MSLYANGTVMMEKNRISLRAQTGETILSALRRAGIVLAAPCGGNGTCGKCRVGVSGDVSPVEEEERRFLGERELAAGVRLACRCRICGDFTVSVEKAAMQIETDYRAVSYDASPMIAAKKTMGGTAFYREDQLIECVPGEAKNLGLAVDIGTTTVAVYLCDMEAGKVLATRAFRNPQAAYGADVISRIDKIMKDKKALFEQQHLISDAVREAGREACRLLGLSFSDVRAAVVCGNTVMEHIAAGIDPSSIANAPFTAPTLFGEYYSAAALSFLENEHSVLYFAPCFASYVGGDIACGMIAEGLDACSDNVLFIDIGTNGEIGLSTKKGLYFCSAAAGPAFEGAHIECGMAGIEGAIDKVYVQEGKILFHSIGDGTPSGICGSGLMDAAAVMLDTGLLDETGRIADKTEAGEYADYIAEDKTGAPLFLIDREHSVYLTGKDIREIQLAKAAICAGIYTLLHKAELSLSDVSSVVLAGGFGSHMNKASACRIGLIPRALEGKITSAGNAAGAGAVAILLGGAPREAARTICTKSDYTELSGDAYFMAKYVDEMMFEL